MFDTLSHKFYDAFAAIRGKNKISEENIESTLAAVRTALLEADVNFKVVKEFVAKVKEEALGEKVLRGVNPGEQFVKIMHDELARVMGEANEEINLNRSGVIPILIVGLNGQGKTTFSAKLAHHLKSKKAKKVLLVPADTFRPAAKDQLVTLAKNSGLDYFDSDLSTGPEAIAKAALLKAAADGFDVVIIDTAGRLHVDNDLMGEIKRVSDSIAHLNPERLLVADAMTGQEAVNVAKIFHETLKLSGVVLSKMDSDARGGAALSIRHVTGVPIRYISTGEKIKDLELFHPDRLAKRILDMGDVLSLVEKAQEEINEEEALSMMNKMEKNRFTLGDFMKQMEMIGRLGSMESILKMIPGMGGIMRQIGDLSPAEAEMKKIKVMMNSMTSAEREDHKLLNNESRIKRIAGGSGTKPQDLKDFLAKFRQMEKVMGPMIAMMKGGGAMPGMPGMGGFPGMTQKGFRAQPNMEGKKSKKGGSPFSKYFK